MGDCTKTQVNSTSDIATIIITKNEEKNLTAAIASVIDWSLVYIVDSFSTDRTRELAESFGPNVKFVEHEFKDYSTQRNWALESLPWIVDWILFLDADERIPPDLASVIVNETRSAPRTVDGFILPRNNIVFGKLLKYGGLEKTYLLRLVRRNRAKWDSRGINEQCHVDGITSAIERPFVHDDMRGIAEWTRKHVRYAELEAERYLSGDVLDNVASLKTQVGRKQWLRRNIWNRLPLGIRPWLFWCRNYVVKGGFLDGKTGLVYHVLWSLWYPMLIDAIILERKDKNDGNEDSRYKP